MYRVCRSFWRVHSIPFTEPLLRGASAGREKNDAKILVEIYTSSLDPLPAAPKKDCSLSSCLIPRSAEPCREREQEEGGQREIKLFC